MEPDKKSKKKHRVRYNVLFVPDVATADVKRFSMSMRIITSICVVIVLVLVAAFVYCYYLTNHIMVANTSIDSLRMEINTLTEEKSALENENNALQEKVSILSETINDKVKAEEEKQAEIEKSFIPTGFPLKGTATYNDVDRTLNEQPAARFTATVGTSVIATANGIVKSVEGDARAGYVITVDHGNGYLSIFHNGSKPLVTEGAQVTPDTQLFVIENRHEELGYQIIENDTYIDPLGLMEIYG